MLRPIPSLFLAALCFFLGAGIAPAEQVRFRYVPIDAQGTTSPVAIGPQGAVGERLLWVGGIPQPFTTQFRPTHLVSFQHPYSNQLIIVPMTFPEGSTPSLMYRGERVIYNYGSYTVSAVFQTDGSVEVIYNSGFFRPLQVQ